MENTLQTVYNSYGAIPEQTLEKGNVIINKNSATWTQTPVPDNSNDGNLEISQVSTETSENQLSEQKTVEIEIKKSARPRPAEFTKHSRTLFASLAAVLGSVSLGSIIGYTSPAIPDLNSGQNPFHLNEMEISWVASIISLGGLSGALFGGFLLDKFGRKFTIILTTVPFSISWAIVAASPNVYCLLFGRFMTGFCAGIMDVGVPVYISEISAAAVRGFMGSCYELGTNFGLLYVFAFGCFLHWNWLAVACLCIPACQIFCMFRTPESPRWLLTRGRKKEALDTLHWLRGENEDISAELSEIEENIRQSGSKVNWSEFRQPTLSKPLIIIIGLMFFQQASGYGAIPEYLVSIFDSAGSSWDPYVQTAVFGLVGFFANLFSAFLVDRAGRRIMLFISSSGMALGMMGLASFFTVKYFAANFSINTLVWLPTVSLIVYNFGVALGYGPIPFYMFSEIFPLRVRGLAGGIGIASLWSFQFITSLAFPHLLVAMSDEGVYWMLSGFSVLSLVFAFFLVPETKGKSLEEIEELFRK